MKTSLGTVSLAVIHLMFTSSAVAIPIQQHVEKVASHLVGVIVRSESIQSVKGKSLNYFCNLSD